jgi:mannosyltransferase
MAEDSRLRSPAILVLGAAVVTGAGLRLVGIFDQLLLSDEWHALHAAATASYSTLFGLLTIGATSIPMNLYDKLLLDTVGWSELWLRMPSLIAGMALLIVFPLLIRRFLSPRALLLASFLLAISPFLVFYSRYCRPYSLVVLLSFVAIVSCYGWAVSGRARDAIAFLVAGASAAFLHFLEIRSLALPLAFLFLVKILERYRGHGVFGEKTIPGPGSLLILSLAAALLSATLLLPALLRTGQGFFEILGRGELTWGSLVGALGLLSGTANPIALVLLAMLAGLGVVLLYSRDRLFTGLVVTVAVGNVATVAISSPARSHEPQILARYLIPLIPLLAMAIAVGVDDLLRWLEKWAGGGRRATLVGSASACVIPGALLLLGPLPSLYGSVNNFTNHKAFHFSYIRRESAADQFASYRNQTLGEEVTAPLARSAFYTSLAADSQVLAVIEYPVPVGDLIVPFAVYQALHGKRVIGGYRLLGMPEGSRTRPGFVMASWPVDFVLSAVENPAKIHLRNYVDIGDAEALRRSGARYLIVHPDLGNELSGTSMPGGGTFEAVLRWQALFGAPIFVDDWLVVFELAR